MTPDLSIAQRLTIDPRVSDDIATAARSAYPHEGCGLLVGNRGHSGRFQVTAFVPCRNIVKERFHDRYVLAPDDFLAAEVAARQAGEEIIGIFHTHPDHPAVPSATDLEAAWHGYVYLITSTLSTGVGSCRAWRLAGDRFEEIPIDTQSMEKS